MLKKFRKKTVINGLVMDDREALRNLIAVKIIFAIGLVLLQYLFGSYKQLENFICFVMVDGIICFNIMASMDKWDKAVVFNEVAPLTVAEFKKAYLSIQKPNYSSRNYFLKQYMELIILDACQYVGINDSGIPMGYIGKTRTSYFFVETNMMADYNATRTQFMVDKFFELKNFNDIKINELKKLSLEAV